MFRNLLMKIIRESDEMLEDMRRLCDALELVSGCHISPNPQSQLTPQDIINCLPSVIVKLRDDALKILKFWQLQLPIELINTHTIALTDIDNLSPEFSQNIKKVSLLVVAFLTKSESIFKWLLLLGVDTKGPYLKNAWYETEGTLQDLFAKGDHHYSCLIRCTDLVRSLRSTDPEKRPGILINAYMANSEFLVELIYHAIQNHLKGDQANEAEGTFLRWLIIQARRIFKTHSNQAGLKKFDENVVMHLQAVLPIPSNQLLIYLNDKLSFKNGQFAKTKQMMKYGGTVRTANVVRPRSNSAPLLPQTLWSHSRSAAKTSVRPSTEQQEVAAAGSAPSS